jgi:hypothetical protein
VFEVDDESGTRWVNANCRADEPCVVRDYLPEDATESSARPLLVFDDREGFALDDPGNANHEEGYVFLNLAIQGSEVEEGFFVYNDIDDVLLCNVSIDRFAIGISLEGSNALTDDSDGLNERVVLRNSTIANCPEQGLVGGCNDCVVQDSTFQNNGYGQTIVSHNMYISGPGEQPIQNMRIVGNYLYQAANVNGSCTGASLVVHGQHENLSIEGNIVREEVGAALPECWGIAVHPGYSRPEGFSGVSIRNNLVMNVGSVGIGVSACSDCTIENNVVMSDQAYGTGGIVVPALLRGKDDAELDSVTIRNNTVYIGSTAGGTGITLGEEGSGHRVLSNAVYYGGNSNRFDCFNLDLAAAEYSDVDYNLCYATYAWAAEWETDSGKLDAWRSATGFDQHSLRQDPCFMNGTGPNRDLTPASGSPLIGNGHPDSSSETDHKGNVRPTRPSIGALEP